MTKRIITEKDMDKLLDQLTWKAELKYSERPGFKQVIDAVKKKRVNCVHMDMFMDSASWAVDMYVILRDNCNL